QERSGVIQAVGKRPFVVSQRGHSLLRTSKPQRSRTQSSSSSREQHGDHLSGHFPNGHMKNDAVTCLNSSRWAETRSRSASTSSNRIRSAAESPPKQSISDINVRRSTCSVLGER